MSHHLKHIRTTCFIPGLKYQSSINNKLELIDTRLNLPIDITSQDLSHMQTPLTPGNLPNNEQPITPLTESTSPVLL